MNDEFYIGYSERGPAGLARRTRRWAAAVAVLFVAAMAAMAVSQRKAEPGRFEYGTTREYSGIFHATPLPRLRVAGADGAATNYWLVGAGKHGLPSFVSPHDGEAAAMHGTLIERGGMRMLEIGDAGSIRFAGPGSPVATGRTEDLGRAAFVGELVDAKCWLGVMRPATGKVHRACAVRCLSGGVPPGLLLRDDSGNAVVVLLAGADGKPLKFDPQWGGRRIEAEGGVESVDGTAVMRVQRMRLAPE